MILTIGDESYKDVKLKARLYKCVNRNDEFLWWTWEGVTDGLPMDFTSGFCDFTLDGSILNLTDEDKKRALTRKIKL